jgi:hypothetical protein
MIPIFFYGSGMYRKHPNPKLCNILHSFAQIIHMEETGITQQTIGLESSSFGF